MSTDQPVHDRRVRLAAVVRCQQQYGSAAGLARGCVPGSFIARASQGYGQHHFCTGFFFQGAQLHASIIIIIIIIIIISLVLLLLLFLLLLLLLIILFSLISIFIYYNGDMYLQYFKMYVTFISITYFLRISRSIISSFLLLSLRNHRAHHNPIPRTPDRGAGRVVFPRAGICFGKYQWLGQRNVSRAESCRRRPIRACNTLLLLLLLLLLLFCFF